MALPCGAVPARPRVIGRGRRSPERLRAEDRLPVPRGDRHRFLVQVVRQPDHDRVHLGVRDRLLEVRRRVWDAVLVGEGASVLLRAGIDHVHSIAAALTVHCQRVEQADQAGAEHRHPVADYRCSLLAFDVSRLTLRAIGRPTPLSPRGEVGNASPTSPGFCIASSIRLMSRWQKDEIVITEKGGFLIRDLDVLRNIEAE